jgi:predicted GNAT family N-acyltransferase
MIDVIRIENDTDLTTAFEIRREVFVVEQEVDPAEEYDEFETTCIHLLASSSGMACGTARIRPVEKGIKLERFAVLKSHRGLGVGAALVENCLTLIPEGTYVYMHAQEHALEFYRKLGFEPKGERFFECDIPHFTMWRQL